MSLKYLDLRFNDISDGEIFEHLKIGLGKSQVVELDLSCNSLGDASVRNIAQALTGTSQMQKLNLTQCKLSQRGANSVFRAIQNSSRLKELTLDKNQLEGSNLSVLSQLILHNNSLLVLNMNQCHLGEDGAQFITMSLGRNRTLQTLSLQENNIGDEGLDYFAKVMIDFHGTNLLHLDLSHNFITDKSGVKFAEGLKENTSFQTICLADNSLTEVTAQVFLDVMYSHPSLTKIDLVRNMVPVKITTEINQICKDNAEKSDPTQIKRLRKEYVATRAKRKGPLGQFSIVRQQNKLE